MNKALQRLANTRSPLFIIGKDNHANRSSDQLKSYRQNEDMHHLHSSEKTCKSDLTNVIIIQVQYSQCQKERRPM